MKQYSESLALGRVGSQKTPEIRKRDNNMGKLKRQGYMVLSVGWFKFKTPNYHFALYPWASHFPSLDPGVLIFKMGLMKPTLPSRMVVHTNKKMNGQELCKSV